MELRAQALEAHERAEDERRLAVAMGLHARIGGGSLLGTLNQKELLRLCMPERARWVYPRIQTECLVCPDEDHDAEEIVFFSFGQSNCGYLCDHRLRLLFRNVYKMYSDRMAVAPRDGQPSFKYLGPPSPNRRLELMLFPDDRGVHLRCNAAEHTTWHPAQEGPRRFDLDDGVCLELTDRDAWPSEC